MKKVKMRLVGLDGNPFSLMGAFQQNARRQGWNKEEIEVVMKKCMSGDYNNLLRVLMEHTEE
jgi:predicted AlkP superfamily phosphohydrolase/phosphomutase